MPKTLFDLSAQCAIDQEFDRALQRDCPFDILFWEKKYPKSSAIFCRTGFSRGRLH